ncbi:MAG: hypothetical protein E6G34_12305 [Actinobacteria bacterium]|nr:MAG: hypothetical protein E6G34_12305 [Actinomycetota bacterium]
MRQIGCYRGLANQCDPPSEGPLNRTARGARALAGVLFIAQVGLLYTWPLGALAKLGLPGAVLWPLAALGLWLGVSHLVAAATGYRGCPEIGAIASLLMRRRVLTSCEPWESFDRRIERRRRQPRGGEEHSSKSSAPA